MNDNNEQASFYPLKTNTFKFRCHKDIPCFTECCADLKLLLTPYDILRLKNRLGISSDEFLEKYSKTVFDEGARFPMIRLIMRDDKKKRCPFVDPQGCSIYEDRPGACRIYPLGRAAMKVAKEKDTREKFFVVNEKHCLGFKEEKTWTLDEWLDNEGIVEYNSMNDQWLEIITSPKSLGPKDNHTRKIQMFFMASYNLDKFKKFIFQSSFFLQFEVDNGLKEEMERNDEVLLTFAINWLKFSLFGEPTMKIKAK